MSGHSKWATSHRQKEIVDAKRGKIFTRLGYNISLAAKQGGDPETNFKLRIAIDKAREANMPKENIERAVKRGTGELEGEQIEETVYEGFGPGGVAMIVEALTTNRNRAVANIKHLFSKHGGNIGASGSVAWMFDRRGVIRIAEEDLKNKNLEELELKLIDLGAVDVIKELEGLVVFTEPADLDKIKKEVETMGNKIAGAETEYVPKNKVASTDPAGQESFDKLLDELEADEDVSNYYSNLND
jgi:YebC/PmpR family DNA-binding regulatory protein